MHRTQLYLDDDLWKALHSRARQQGTTISELMRQAARKEYIGKLEGRREAMQAFVGICKDRDLPDSTQQVRSLRRGARLERLSPP
jgi:Ribbon-helix-helix protein, copG family